MQERDQDVLEARRARQSGEWPGHSFLASLRASTFEDLLAACAFVRVRRGETLVREHERDSGAVYFLISACVKVTARAEVGTEALLAIRVGGDIVGELALIDDEPRSATATACRAAPSVVLTLGRAEFHDFLEQHPDAALCLTRTVAKRLRWANRRRVEFGGCPVKVRAARVILELVAAHGVQLPFNGTSIGALLSQGEFASLIGAAQPSVQKALRELRDAGLIDTGYRTLAVVDLPGLRRTAGLPAEENASF